MSSQAGIWNFRGLPVEPGLLARFARLVKPYGPDGGDLYADGSFAMLFHAFHTTRESRAERQPYESTRGQVFTWDGRLDNRDELSRDLAEAENDRVTDLDLAFATFRRYGTGCFERLIGEWALAIWTPEDRQLILAVDYVASRHLFYALNAQGVSWSTNLAPLVLLSRDRFHLDENYVAGYFASDPEAHLTPYREISEVPGGHFIRIQSGTLSVERYWQYGQGRSVRYKKDSDYEEHFQHVFREAVRRRLRSDAPVLAELSGGLDSSSIVCTADDILAREGAPAIPRLDTLSYFDTTEPNGDDWIFFRKVERARGRTGAHIDTGRLCNRARSFAIGGFSALPGLLGTSRELHERRSAVVRDGAYRVVLSGLGGDELMGGIPNPLPQLGDLIVQGELPRLCRQLVAWSLVKRRPCIQLLWQAAIDLLPGSLRQFLVKQAEIEPWIDRDFAKRTHMRGRRLDVCNRLGRGTPTWRYYLGGVIRLGYKLAKHFPTPGSIEEYRYPYLDQNLVEFVLSIPADQLLRPGERRSLMRRSLSGIVPCEILARRTKQLGERTPLLLLENNWDELQRTFRSSLSSRLGYLEDNAFLRSLAEAKAGKKIPIVSMLRAIAFEFWLQDLNARHLLALGEAPLDREERVLPNPIATQNGFRHFR